MSRCGVCVPVCLSRQSTAAETCSWFAAARLRVADIERQLLNAMLTATCYGPVSVCLSQVGVLSKRIKRIELVFGVGATSTFRLSYTNLFKGNMGRPIFKNKGTFLRNFIQNSREKKICFGISIVETCYGLCSRMVDAQSVINCTVVGQLS